MKHLLPGLLLVALTACAAATNTVSQPRIELEVKGAPSGSVYLIATVENQNYRLDSAEVGPAGSIMFQPAEAYPSGLLYALLPDETYVPLLVDTDQAFVLRTQSNDLIGSMQVEGSLDNELLYRSLQLEAQHQAILTELQNDGSITEAGLQQRQQDLEAERRAFLEQLFEQHPESFFTSFKRAGQNPQIRTILAADGTPDEGAQVAAYRKDFWAGVDLTDERLLRTPVIANKLQRFMTELTVQHQDSIIAAADYLLGKVLDKPAYFQFFANWIAVHYEPTKVALMDAEAVYVHMVQNYFTQERAFWADSMTVYGLQQRAGQMAASRVGQIGPTVTANDPAGNPRSTADIDAPYLIVYLYNPDCDHCIEETPRLVDFYHQWKDRGVGVYAIAIDAEPAIWRQFIQANQMDWVNVMDPTNAAIYGKYYVDNTPEIYVLNPDRRIIGKNLKVHQIETIITRDQNSNL